MWVTWYIYWIVSAFGAKRVQRRESTISLATHRLPILFAVLLLFLAPRLPPVLSGRVIPRDDLTSCLAVALVALGLGFAAWARRHLAGNWSANVTLKEDHQLIRTGPYRLVRNPIYTGMLVAVMGTVIAMGTPLGLILFVAVAVAFVRKIAVEEQFMTAAFGAEFESYRSSTASLIQYLW
jgi:protein-S-isoprenylcysteine O-methyltransferase Ste14